MDSCSRANKKGLIFFSILCLCRKHFSEDVIQFTALLDFGDRGKEKQLTEAAQQIEELKSKEESLKQGSWNF